jgi:hypothetical protein
VFKSNNINVVWSLDIKLVRISDLTRSDSDPSVENLSLPVCYGVSVGNYLLLSMAQSAKDLNLQQSRCEKPTFQPRSLVGRVKMCVQATSGHFEGLLQVVRKVLIMYKPSNNVQIIFNYKHLLIFSDRFTVEKGTDIISRNVGNELLRRVTSRKTKGSLTPLRKSDISQPLLCNFWECGPIFMNFLTGNYLRNTSGSNLYRTVNVKTHNTVILLVALYGFATLSSYSRKNADCGCLGKVLKRIWT